MLTQIAAIRGAAQSLLLEVLEGHMKSHVAEEKNPAARRAEVASLLRFAGGLHIQGGRVIVEAEVDTGITARRLRKEILDLYGYNSDVHVLSAGGLRKAARYIVRVVKDGEALARQTGLVDGHHLRGGVVDRRPVRRGPRG